MATCPKCEGEIAYLALLKHTPWTPVVCPQCDTRLRFDTRDCRKRVALLFLHLFLLSGGLLLVAVKLGTHTSYLVVYSVLASARLIKFGFDSSKVILRERESKGLSNQPSEPTP